MTETVTLVADASNMSDMVNLQYRASFYLGLGYGAVYIGPDLLPDGKEIEGTFREDLVQSFDAERIQGFSKKDEDEDGPVMPSIKNPSVQPPHYLESAIGEGPSEGPDEYDDEEDSAVCAPPVLHHGRALKRAGFGFIMNVSRR